MTVKYKLPNKLSVILLESKKAPVVSSHLWVKTGSADERKGEEGISHFIEHLVFKGTKDFKMGEIAQVIEGSGGQLNAYTTFDQTVYYMTISKNYYEKSLHAISQMVGFASFDPNEINNEREVVIEEIRRSEDSPGNQASQLLFKSSFSRHPYGTPIIGYEKIIKKVSRKTLTNYYAKRYVPQNMTLIVAGDFDAKTMKQKIQQYFGEIKSGKLESRSRKKDTKNAETKIVVKASPFEESYAYLAWRVPDIKHKDIVALDVLSMMLGEGDSSRLYRKMRLESPLVNYVGTSCFTLKDPGLFLVAASLSEKNIVSFFEKLGEGLKEILMNPPTVDELKRCITLLEADEYYDLETVDGLSRKAGFLDYFLGDYRAYPKYLKKVYNLKPEDISAVARKYLDPKNLIITVMEKKQKESSKKAINRWAKNFNKDFNKAKKAKIRKVKTKRVTQQIQALGGKGLSPKFSEHKLKNGLRVIFRLADDTPVVSVRNAMLGGLRSEPNGKEGLTDLLARSWCAGAGNLSEKEINELTDAMATRLSAFSGRNSAGLSMTMLAPFEDQSIQIFGKILSNPHFTENIISREKEVMLEALKTQLDQPSYVATLEFLKEMFKGHPYSRDPQGTSGSILSLDRDDVKNCFRDLTQSEGSLTVISGSAKPERWLEMLESTMGQWKVGKKLNNVNISKLESDVSKYKTLDKEQSHIIVGYRGLTVGSSDSYAMQLLQSILGGMGGRLFVELREKASLAYSVSPLNFEGTDTGYCGAYIGCAPDKGRKAIEMILAEFEKIMHQPPTTEELERAKRYLIGKHDIELQRNSAIAGGILFNELYGLPYKDIFEYANKIQAVKKEDVQKLAQRIFSQKKVTVAVGAKCPW